MLITSVFSTNVFIKKFQKIEIENCPNNNFDISMVCASPQTKKNSIVLILQFVLKKFLNLHTFIGCAPNWTSKGMGK